MRGQRPDGANATPPLAPFFRRRLAPLLALMTSQERAIVRLLPVLLGARFRRPGLDKDPPGLTRMPTRRRWGHACEVVDLPPPLGFGSSRPLIRSALVVPRPGGWDVELHIVSDCTPDDLRRLDARLQALKLLVSRRAPTLELKLASEPPSAERLFFAGLAAGTPPPLPTQPSLEMPQVVALAPTPLSRALALTASTENPFRRLLPGLALASPDRFAAAASIDERLLPLVRQLGIEPGVVELELASRVVRHAAHLQWKRLRGAVRRAMATELKRSVMGAQMLPALRPLLEKLIDSRKAAEVQDPSGGWRLELDEHPILTAPTLDALRARALSETPRLCPAQGEWRRARALLASRTPKTLFVVEPGFVKHLALTVGPSGRLRARRLTSEACVRLALALRVADRTIEVSARPGASPLLTSRLSQVAAATPAPGTSLAIEHGERLLLAEPGRLRDLRFTRALARPRAVTLLPARAVWGPALRPPRAVQGRAAVRVTIDAPEPGRAQALFVDAAGRLLLDAFASDRLSTWLEDTRALVERAGASFSPDLSPALAMLAGRLPPDDVAPIELVVRVGAGGHTEIELEEERFGAGSALGWRALAETVFSHWPPQQRGRIRVTSIEHRGAAVSALEVLAVRARVLRRLSGHLASLARRLEAA